MCNRNTQTKILIRYSQWLKLETNNFPKKSRYHQFSDQRLLLKIFKRQQGNSFVFSTCVFCRIKRAVPSSPQMGLLPPRILSAFTHPFTDNWITLNQLDLHEERCHRFVTVIRCQMLLFLFNIIFYLWWKIIIIPFNFDLTENIR